MEGQEFQIGEIPEFHRDWPGQPINAEAQDFQMRKAPKFLWDHSRQPVGNELQYLQAGEAPEFRRNLALQSILTEIQDPQVGQRAQFRRDLPRQLVLTEIQDSQEGERTQFRRDRPGQSVPNLLLSSIFTVDPLGHPQSDHPAPAVHLDPRTTPPVGRRSASCRCGSNPIHPAHRTASPAPPARKRTPSP